MVGYVIKRIEGINCIKFFYYDKKSDSVVFLIDYFLSFSLIVNDINDNGVIVGEGEIDIYNMFICCCEGFMYIIGEDKVVNLNDLLFCYEEDGEIWFKYVVVEVKLINNNNEIFGVVIKMVEKIDLFGNMVVDFNGNVEYESIVVFVKLILISGLIEECFVEEVE